MHFRTPTKGSTNTDFKLEFSSQLKHTKHELGSKAWQFEDMMEKHSIRLPLLLQVRAMYSTVRHKNTCSGFKKINTFFIFSSYNVILKIHKERYPFVFSKSKAVRVLHKEDCGGQGDAWQLANNCAGRIQHGAQVVPPAGPIFQLHFQHVFLLPSFSKRAAEITVWAGAFCFRVLIANPIWLFGYMGLLLCRRSHYRSPTLELGKLLLHFRSKFGRIKLCSFFSHQ